MTLNLRSRFGRLLVIALIAIGVWVLVGQSRSGSKPPASQPIELPGLTEVGGSYVLTIEQIGVRAPIILNVDGTNKKAYLQAIEDGVAHYKGTATPGQLGNSFIFGHSSYFKDKPGRYKEIFSRLDKVKKGDLVEIRHQQEKMTYKVSEGRIVKADDLSVLEPTDQETLTIMTCWPPGTIDKRYVVRAERV